MDIIKLSDQLIQTESIAELSKAMVAFHDLFSSASLTKDAKNNRSAYVSLDNLLNTVRPLLNKAGLAITQDLAGDYLATTIMHTSGEFKTAMMPFNPMDGKGINSLQAIGGGITYAKRYALAAALLISVDTDDDGAGSGSMNAKPKAKPLLSPTMDRWKGAVEAIASGKTNIAAIKKIYRLTKEHEALLNEIEHA